MTDEKALDLMMLLDEYVMEYGGFEPGKINPHEMTLSQLKQDLLKSTGLDFGYGRS